VTVVLNEVALKALLDTQDGPVGRYVQSVAQAVVVEAQRNVKGYFGSAPSLEGRVDQDVDYEMEGSSAVVGIRDGGSKARRLARYQSEGRFPWLQRALETARSRF
jgi:hypothetical protein